MDKLPTRTVHIKKEIRIIIAESLEFLDRDYGDAVNYVLKKGIETLGLPKKAEKKSFHPIHERRDKPRSKAS